MAGWRTAIWLSPESFFAYIPLANMLRVVKAKGECHGFDVTRYVVRILGTGDSQIVELSHVRDVEDAEKLIELLGARHVGKTIDERNGNAKIVDHYEAPGVKIDVYRQDVGTRDGNCRKGYAPAVPLKAYVEGLIRAPICQEGDRRFL